jgi:hypothetical protein
MPGCYPPPALSNYSSATDLQLKDHSSPTDIQSLVTGTKRLKRSWQLMSNLGDLINIGKDNAGATEIAGRILSFAADFSGDIGTLQLIAGLLSSDSGMQDALTALQESVNNLIARSRQVTNCNVCEILMPQ